MLKEKPICPKNPRLELRNAYRIIKYLRDMKLAKRTAAASCGLKIPLIASKKLSQKLLGGHVAVYSDVS